jgi:transposase-like protein
MRDTPAMLRELNVVEQRYQAVLEVLDGTPVTEVAQRFGVARQTVHRWVARYRESGWTDWLIGHTHRRRIPGGSAARTASRDIRRHKASNYSPAASSPG